ncbi:MAG: ATP-dependent endonuclease of the family-like protein, partial [Adhaeribacter sp.]|nr:ATP-dependent endonuclease of the family-like protein [Adhaeribacter sp.]
MRLKKCHITNFRGIKNKIEVCFDDFIVIVGINDAGKSTILKALDLFLNDSEASRDMLNISAENQLVEIECVFNANHKDIIIDDSVTTTFELEGLTNEEGLLHIKKVYNTSLSRITPEVFIKRKKFENSDFVLLPEDGLRKLCQKFGISTAKANGDIYNNVEKRQKLRNYL